MPSDWELGWASGLFEGEGCFAASRNRPPSVNLRARLVSTDEDAVRSFCRIVGVGNVTGPHQQKAAGQKDYWSWATSGPNVEIVYALIEPGLGTRRRARYAELVAERRAYEARIPELRSDAANRSWATRRSVPHHEGQQAA